MGDEYPSLFRAYLSHNLSVSFSKCWATKITGSEQMSLVQLFVPTEVAHDTVAELGELGNVQFKDVRFHFTRTHARIHPTPLKTYFVSSTQV